MKNKTKDFLLIYFIGLGVGLILTFTMLFQYNSIVEKQMVKNYDRSTASYAMNR